MPLEIDPDDLKTSAHAGLNHAGIPGVGDLTTAAHASLNHTGIPGIPVLGSVQTCMLPFGGSAAAGSPLPFNNGSAGALGLTPIGGRTTVATVFNGTGGARDLIINGVFMNFPAGSSIQAIPGTPAISAGASLTVVANGVGFTGLVNVFIEP